MTGLSLVISYEPFLIPANLEGTGKMGPESDLGLANPAVPPRNCAVDPDLDLSPKFEALAAPEVRASELLAFCFTFHTIMEYQKTEKKLERVKL